MRAAILSRLSGDALLMSYLSGGVHSASQISRQETPAAFDDNGEIRPCALLKMGTQTPVPPHRHGATLHFTLYFYERSGYTNVDAARERAYKLLHKSSVTPFSGSCWEIDHADDVLDARDDVLDCSLEVSRYVAYVLRE